MEKIKKFEKIIKENESGMFQIIILYNMSCHSNYIKINENQKEILLGIIYNIYLRDENNIDISCFSDIVMEFYKEILKMQNNSQFYNIKEFIYNKL